MLRRLPVTAYYSRVLTHFGQAKQEANEMSLNMNYFNKYIFEVDHFASAQKC